MATTLDVVFAAHRKAILRAWFQRVIETYPPDTTQFLKSSNDAFANPVGQATRKGLSALFDLFLGDMDATQVRSALDPIIRIRAVQDFKPSQAVVFVLALKAILRDHVGSSAETSDLADTLAEADARIDAMSLAAFDVYVQCREKLLELKVRTEKDKIYRAFSRAGLIVEEEESAVPSPQSS